MVHVDNNLQQLALTVFYLLSLYSKPCFINLKARLWWSSSIHPLSKEKASLAPFPLKSDFLWLDDTDKRFEESLFDLYFCKKSSVLFPYNKQWKIISLTTILQTFLFTFAAILSQILPDPHLHSFHPACTQSPLLWTLCCFQWLSPGIYLSSLYLQLSSLR